MGAAETAPRGELAIRTVARPRDTNAVGDIFGGWIMSQMDFAGGLTAWWRARGRVATVAVQSMEFHLPVRVGDLVSVYAEVLKIGNISVSDGGLGIDATVPLGAQVYERAKYPVDEMDFAKWFSDGDLEGLRAMQDPYFRWLGEKGFA